MKRPNLAPQPPGATLAGRAMGLESTRLMNITIKTPDEIEKMRVAGRLTADVLDMIGPYVQPGVTTDELDRLCHDYIVNVQQAIPAPLNYRGFPKSICTSVNHVVCHGIPGDRKLRAGDIVNIDITVIKDGYHGDSSRMFAVGKPSVQAARVMQVSHEAMWRGIRVVAPGSHLGDIGYAVQSYTEENGCSIVREYCGHGIGRIFHEDPQVLHYGTPGRRARIARRHDVHHRADGQCRTTPCATPAGWLDRGHQGPLPVGPVGAHGAGHRGWRGRADIGRGGSPVSTPAGTSEVGDAFSAQLSAAAQAGEHYLAAGGTALEWARIDASLAAAGTSVERLREVLQGANGALTQRFLAGQPATDLVADQTVLVDRIIRAAWDRTCGPQMPDAVLAAVGGYGRGELHPFSDVDLLVLLPTRSKRDVREPVSAFLALLWDIGLQVGHSTRTVEECRDEMPPRPHHGHHAHGSALAARTGRPFQPHGSRHAPHPTYGRRAPFSKPS